MLLLLEVAAVVIACLGPLVPAFREIAANDYLARHLDVAARWMFLSRYWREFFVLLVATQIAVALAWLGRRFFATSRRALIYAGLVALSTALSFEIFGGVTTLLHRQDLTAGQRMLIRAQLSQRAPGRAETLRALLRAAPPASGGQPDTAQWREGLTGNPFAPLKHIAELGWWWVAALFFAGFLGAWVGVWWLILHHAFRWTAGKPSRGRGRRMSRRRLAVLLVAPLATFCFVGSLSLNARPSPPADRPPNVLLISIDTLRADHVGCYGYARQTTPKIDAMAARGVIFERAISQSNTTLPAHASMLTGLYPIEHGCDPARQTALSPRVDTLAEIMLQHGYHTAAVTSVSWVSAEFGLDQGFERFLYHERSAAPQVKRALRLLADFGDRPFFLFVHLFDPHSPYTPPAQYHDMFLAPGEDRGVDGDIMRFFATRDMRAPDPHAVDILRKLYDGEIRYVDDYLGRIFRWLDEHKKLDDTVVIVTADHGESFGENGAWVHGTALYAQQLHVPLIIAYPRRVQPGTRRAELVEASVNILPTILDLVGIPAPARVGRGSLLVRRAAPARVFSENMLSLLPQYAVQDDTWKLTTVLANGRLNRASAQLFRTAEWTDAHDLAAQYPDVVSEYLGRLESYFTFGHGHQTPAAAPASLSPATIQQLRSLGYLR